MVRNGVQNFQQQVSAKPSQFRRFSDLRRERKKCVWEWCDETVTSKKQSKCEFADRSRTTHLTVRGPFLESPDNFSGPKSSFTFVVLAFKIKVSITLKMRQCNHQLTKQNWPVCELGTVPLFNRFWFQNLPSDSKGYGPFEKRAPGSPTTGRLVVCCYSLPHLI